MPISSGCRGEQQILLANRSDSYFYRSEHTIFMETFLTQVLRENQVTFQASLFTSLVRFLI